MIDKTRQYISGGNEKDWGRAKSRHYDYNPRAGTASCSPEWSVWQYVAKKSCEEDALISC